VFEHPIVLDVDADGAAEIATAAGASRSTQGTLRIYKSDNQPWASARKVWNQFAYNVVNVNEDLTVPRYQLNPATLFPNGKQPYTTSFCKRINCCLSSFVRLFNTFFSKCY
jgi:hypothetical protein